MNKLVDVVEREAIVEPYPKMSRYIFGYGFIPLYCSKVVALLQ
jgi:hypothetical protein